MSLVHGTHKLFIMHSFKVSELEINEFFAKRKPQMNPWVEGASRNLEGSTLYSSDAETVGGNSPLFHTLSYAFNNHCPLVLSPDSVWLTLLVGLTHHIDTDPEGLRRHFVSHEGKKKLEVFVNAPSIHRCGQDIWEVGINGFSTLLSESMNQDKHDLIVSDFSTTTSIDKLSSKVALMGAMKHFFEYKMMLCCGLTDVTILGTPEDWQSIINRVEMFSEFDLSWWTSELLPILKDIKKSCEGEPDIEFWKQAYLKHRYGSGGQFNVSGWVNTFFPYIAGKKQGQMSRNHCMQWESSEGIDDDDFPSGLVCAPVQVIDHGTPYDCKFYGGLVGVSMQEDFTVKAESGIAIQLLDKET